MDLSPPPQSPKNILNWTKSYLCLQVLWSGSGTKDNNECLRTVVAAGISRTDVSILPPFQGVYRAGFRYAVPMALHWLDL